MGLKSKGLDSPALCILLGVKEELGNSDMASVHVHILVGYRGFVLFSAFCKKRREDVLMSLFCFLQQVCDPASRLACIDDKLLPIFIHLLSAVRIFKAEFPPHREDCKRDTMRHIHVELAHKKAPLELPAQEGDLPPTTAPTNGLDPGVRAGALRHFGQEELRLQKVYQLSIFSQMGGFSTSAGSYSDSQQRQQRKRGVEEPQLTHKHSHLDDSTDGPVLQGGVLCGSAPALGIGMGLATEPGEPGSPYSYMQLESEGGLSPRSPPLSPSHTPSRRSSHCNRERPVADAFAPLSPKSPPMGDPHGHICDQGHSFTSSVRVETTNGSRTPTHPIGSPAHDGYTTGSSGGQPTPHLYEMPTYESPNPASPTSPPGPFSPPHHTELQEPGVATEWDAGLESSPPERSATHTATSNGLASWEKTPCSNGHRLFSGGHVAAKKRLLSPSETNDSLSEDEGPSTSKRSRLSLLTSGPGPASCRSTDAKAAPYWNHLLPTAREMPKVRKSNIFFFSLCFQTGDVK